MRSGAKCFGLIPTTFAILLEMSMHKFIIYTNTHSTYTLTRNNYNTRQTLSCPEVCLRAQRPQV